MKKNRFIIILSVLTIDAQHYGNRIISYLESKGISWMCWVYVPEWGPRLLKFRDLVFK